jgi:hypothetical protein
MATTNYTITGNGIGIKDQFGVDVNYDISFAVVQWQAGYNPAYYPFNEWASNPTFVGWSGTYSFSTKTWSSTANAIDFDGPLFLWTNLGQGGVGLYQITSILNNDGASKVVDLNQTNITAAVGAVTLNTLHTTDLNTWTPTAIPEPSYSAFAVVLFAVAVVIKKVTSPKKQQCEV